MDWRTSNRCQEWGAPHVPILAVMRDEKGTKPKSRVGSRNPDPEWTKTILQKIKDDNLKKVHLWDPEEKEQEDSDRRA